MALAYDESSDAPVGVLPKKQAAALVRRCCTTDARKRRAYERHLIYTESHQPLIINRIVNIQHDEETRKEVALFVDVTVNPGLDIIKDTSVVWRQGVRRTISDISEDQLAAFHELTQESWIDVEAQDWNELAELEGTVIVVPAIKREQLCWEVLLPFYSDVEPDPEDLLGNPLAVAWTISPGAPAVLGKVDCVVLDGWSWRYYSNVGGQPKLLNEVVHGLGYFPGSTLRFHRPHGGDWHGCGRNQRLVDATVVIGLLNAQLGFIRRSQSHQLLTLIGNLAGWPKGQRPDPGVPCVSDTGDGQGNSLNVNVLDFDQSPKNFVEHSDFVRRNVAAAYGGVVQQGGDRIVFSTEALTEIRNRQIPFAREFERDLWGKAVAMAQAMLHPLASRLPAPEVVSKGFRVDFGKLTRTFANPAEETAYIDWLKKNGQTDQIEIARQLGNTTQTDAQIRAAIEHRLDNLAWFHDLVTKRDMGLSDDASVQTAAQALGAAGPAIRDAAKPRADAPADAEEVVDK